MRRTCSLLSALVVALSLQAQLPPPEQWQRCLGGSLGEEAWDVEQTADGGYIVVGDALSTNGDVSDPQGDLDCWVVKLSPTGTTQWERSLGGSGTDSGRSVAQTADGGYIIGARTSSSDGDVSGWQGGADHWLLKLDAAGELQWQRTLGGSSTEQLSAVVPCMDGGYAVSGWSYSSDGDVSGNLGDADFWVVKLDAGGALEWEEHYGGSASDQAQALQQTADGGFVVVGSTLSINGDVTGQQGLEDVWVLRLAADGILLWQRTLGGTVGDAGTDIICVPDGFVIAATSKSSDGDLSVNNGSFDLWVVKIDLDGALVWERSFGGMALDQGRSVRATADGGYLVAGTSGSSNGDLDVNQGGDDIWVLRLNGDGELVWKLPFGGPGYDWASSVRPTSDGGFVLAGGTMSSGGDVLMNNGPSDLLVVKFGEDAHSTGVAALEEEAGLWTYPNPATELLNIHCTLRSPGNLGLELFNALGQPVGEVGAGGLRSAGEHHLNLSVGHLPPGVYQLRSHFDGRVLTQKVVKR